MDGTEFLYIFMSTRVDESRTVDRCILLGQTAVYRFMASERSVRCAPWSDGLSSIIHV